MEARRKKQTHRQKNLSIMTSGGFIIVVTILKTLMHYVFFFTLTLVKEPKLLPEWAEMHHEKVQARSFIRLLLKFLSCKLDRILL